MVMRYDEKGFEGHLNTDRGLETYERVALAHIRHIVVLRISLYALAAIILMFCAALVIFAPTGREIEVRFISIALLIVAAGSAGFATLKLKAPLVSAQLGGVLRDSDTADS